MNFDSDKERKKKLLRISKALKGLREDKDDDKNTVNTKELVDSVKEYMGIPYADLARVIARCSLPGLHRWRHKDINKAKTARIKYLVDHAKMLVGETSDEADKVDSKMNVADAFRSHKLEDIEGRIAVALESALAVSIEKCRIEAFTTTNQSVKIELIIE